ncbi:hypothetical protein [Tahibacter sp.]|uniref:hypothetical protein n=1 Tax=Tahibacter sp. TaxID=2056211 RepID=UPI0028C3FD39|nr:hypothetical protein [Tahibacter sp.]
MSMSLLLGWLCSLLLGSSIWLAIAGPPRRLSDGLAAAGYSVLLGVLGSGLLVGLRSEISGEGIFVATLPLLGVISAFFLGVGYWRWRRATPAFPVPAASTESLPRWCWLLLVLIAIRFAFVLDEAMLRPVFAWDAWNAWSLKAKTWFSLGQVPYLEPAAWWQDSGTAGHTALAWRYPELLSRAELWFAGAAGGWNEGAVATAWPLLWLALISGCAGQWMALGVSRLHSLILAYMLASLPLLSVHAGLAGYADIWVAAALTFAVLSWMRWVRDDDRAQLLFALLCIALLPLLKFEGAVWALLLVGLALLAQVPVRWRWAGLGAGLLLALLAMLVSWLLQLPWLALVGETLSGVTTNGGEVSRVTAALAFLNGLFGQNNWHLLWPLLAACVIWRRDVLRRQRETALLAVLVAGGLAALFCLFAFTPAAKWAASETATNRLVLHWVPLALSLLGLLLRDVPWPTRTPPVSPR